MRGIFIIKKYLKMIAVFALFFLLSMPRLIDICTGYLKYIGYDIQEFLLWNYSSLGNVILYKDIFYPYGLLHYYRNSDHLLLLLNYLITPLIFTIFFILFKKIFKEKYFLYISLFSLYLFTFTVTGFEIFSRYGILVSVSLLYSYLLYSRKISLRPYKLFIGFIIGLVFSLVNDQGSYLIFSYIFLSFFNEAIRKKIKFSLKYFINLISSNMLQGVGFFLGLIPLLTYLIVNNSIIEYFKYFRDVGDIAIVAKTPFIAFITSPANLLTISILILALFFLLINNFYFRKKLSLSSYFQLTLIFDILLLEQKSMIRSIDRQLTFISFILFILLFYELVKLLSKHKIKPVSIKFFFTSILILIIFISSVKLSISQFKFQDLGRVVNPILNNRCYADNLSIFLSENTEYVNVVSELKKQPGFNNKVFSFSTGDSVFYAMLGQKPPYYNAIFEGSSKDNQLQTIEYIKNNDIDYITLNTDMKYIQDGVPDYIRQPVIFKYILSSYYPIKKIDNHLILKRSSGKDFFVSELLSQASAFKKHLLEVYLYRIPYSEGLYKYDLLKNSKPFIKTADIKTINGALGKKDYDLSGKIIVMIPSSSLPSSFLNYVLFKSSTGQSSVSYNSCKKNKPCIINLSNIPFFYRERIISQITLDNKFKGSIAIYDLKDLSNLW